jgi:hypothetical protein
MLHSTYLGGGACEISHPYIYWRESQGHTQLSVPPLAFLPRRRQQLPSHPNVALVKVVVAVMTAAVVTEALAAAVVGSGGSVGGGDGDVLDI